jgi:hypothetical protein
MAPIRVSEDFENFVRERREQSEQTRRLLIGVLAGTCVALVVSNVALALWITSGLSRRTVEAPARSTAELSARPAPGAEPPSASVPSRADSPPSVTLPTTAEPTASEPRTATAPDEQTPGAATPRVATPRAETPRADTRPPLEPALPAPDAPRRSPAPTAPRPRTAANAPAVPDRAMSTTPGFPAPEEATAAWMVTTYGRPDAEARARTALEFYDARSAESRYWRRVLGLITAAR